MEPFAHSDLVEVRPAPNKGRGGRGVFARRLIGEGAVIERVPVILIPKHQVFGETTIALRSCRISWYVFDWGMQEGHEYVALPLGFGSIYNHSYQPNATFRLEVPDRMEFVALKEIKQGEEITINYNGRPEDKNPVGFLVTE